MVAATAARTILRQRPTRTRTTGTAIAAATRMDAIRRRRHRRHRHRHQTRTRTAVADAEVVPVTVLVRRGNHGRDWVTLRRRVGRTGRTLGNRFWGRPCTVPALTRHPVPSRYTHRLRANRPASQNDRGCRPCLGSQRHMQTSIGVSPVVKHIQD